MRWKRKYSICMPRYMLYKVWKNVLMSTNGEYDEIYDKLFGYIFQVYGRNHGLQAMVHCLSPTINALVRFQCFFEALLPKKNKLKGYQPFLNIYKCYLKGKYSGVLLSVVGINTNLGIFPTRLQLWNRKIKTIGHGSWVSSVIILVCVYI